ADLDARRISDGSFNRWFLDPVYGRHYPADIVHAYGELGILPNGLDFVQDGDMDVIAAPTDWLGVNVCTRSLVKASDGLYPDRDIENATLRRTDLDWAIYPQGFYNLLCRLHFDYRVPNIIVTENGAAFNDGVGA